MVAREPPDLASAKPSASKLGAGASPYLRATLVASEMAFVENLPQPFQPRQFEALALAQWLAENGWSEVFLDLDPERGIAAGERWERALHAAAQRCEAVVFLVSQHWLASRWCGREFSLARGLNKKLFGVIVEPGLGIDALPQEFAGTWQTTDLCAGTDLSGVRPNGLCDPRPMGQRRTTALE
jgi:hypothetical protein